MFGKKSSTRMYEAAKDSSVLGQSLAWLAICIALVVAGARWLGIPEANLAWVDRLVMYIGFLLLILAFLWHELRTVRSRRYAKIQQHLHSIMHTIRDQHTVLDAIDEERAEFETHEYLIRSNIAKVLDQFAFSFSMLTGTNCRTSIKLIFLDEGETSNEPYVSTYVRDQISSQSEGDRDTKRRDGGMDAIRDNTDFKVILKNGKRWFSANNLPTLSNYENTSDPGLMDRHLGFIESILNHVKPVKWNLPYTSTFVWPIQKRLLDEVDGTEFAILGFLTVDSPSRRVFNEKHDAFFGAAVADTLFPLVRRMQLLGDKPDE